MGNHEIHDQDSRPWELNPGLPNCEAGVLPLHHTGLVLTFFPLLNETMGFQETHDFNSQLLKHSYITCTKLIKSYYH